MKNQGGSQKARDGRIRSQDFIPEAEGVQCKQLFWEEWDESDSSVDRCPPPTFFQYPFSP